MLSEHKPRGGRGIKAPYQTQTIRTPTDLIPVLENLIDDYRATGIVPSQHNSTIPYDEAVKNAKIILESKIGRTKSAKVSMEKLLQVIYEIETNL